MINGTKAKYVQALKALGGTMGLDDLGNNR
jgi:hypothetical protein